LDYRITTRQTLTANFQTSFFPANPLITSTNRFSTGQSNSIDSAVTTINNEASNRTTSQANILYRYKLDTIGSRLDAGYYYINLNNTYTADAIYNYTFPTNNTVDFSSGLSTDNPSKISIHTFSVNLLKKISKTLTYQLGAKYTISNTDNAITYFSGVGNTTAIDTQRSNTFKYHEKILAIFGALTKNWKNWGLKVGLRAENTNYDGISVTSNQDISFNRWSLFPSVFLQNQINNTNSVTLAYSRSIYRPAYQLLNPFENIQNPFYIQKGNPFLLPYFSNVVELSFLMDGKYNFTVGYKSTPNQIDNIFRNEGAVIISTYDNIDNNSNAYASAYIPVTLAKWWELSSSITFRYAKLTINDPGDFREKAKFSQFIQVASKFNLNKGFYIEARGLYVRNQFLGLYDQDPQGKIDMDFKKSFINDKLTIALNLSDPFNLQKIGYNIQESGFTRDVIQYLPTRYAMLGLSYNIQKGKKKINREQINPQNGEEQNRLYH